MRPFLFNTIKTLYRLWRPVLYLSNPESIHERMTKIGEILGKVTIAKFVIGHLLQVKSPSLQQTIGGITFENPVGLAAGYDYYAQLPQIIENIGFGFESVGTITNQPYGGNTPPRLGRLIKSKSLMVNKGFKNAGIQKTLEKLSSKSFSAPIGISIGNTNSKTITKQEDAIADILSSFRAVEESSVPFSYYELNISCPNLMSGVEFYSPQNLSQLLKAVTDIKLKKPLFIKMPIQKSNEETLDMIRVIASFPVQGVIIGNLQKDRNDPALVQEEIKKFPVGNFSGKPTEERSNKLIALAYKNFGTKLTIIGCGGIFSAEDAYTKIKLGASLVQLITGLIFVGPQLPAHINLSLIRLLAKDGYSHISQAIGASEVQHTSSLK